MPSVVWRKWKRWVYRKTQGGLIKPTYTIRQSLESVDLVLCEGIVGFVGIFFHRQM